MDITAIISFSGTQEERRSNTVGIAASAAAFFVDKFRGEMRDACRCIGVMKGEELYMVAYDDESKNQVPRVAEHWMKNPHLRFDHVDAKVLLKNHENLG